METNKTANEAERKQKCGPDKNEGFSDFEPLASNAENQPEQPFGVEGIYNEAMARTEKQKCPKWAQPKFFASV